MKVAEGLAVGACVTALAIQVAAIVAAPLTQERHLAWAPLHEQAWFRIEASVQGQPLTEAQLEARYHLRGYHFDPASHESWQLNDLRHVYGVIDAIERGHAPEQQAMVRVTARVNGTPVSEWRWPP
jgi:hypothetical protein